MAERYRILLVEDEEEHAQLVFMAFQKEWPKDIVKSVYSAQQMLACLKAEQFDLFIIDYSLPDLDGIQLIEELNRQEIQTPIIIITGHGNEVVAVQLMKLGVSDYLVKANNFPASLPSIAHKTIESHRLKRRFDVAEAHLQFQALMLDNVHDAIIGIDTTTSIIYWNKGAAKIFGWQAEDILGEPLHKVIPTFTPDFSNLQNDSSSPLQTTTEGFGITSQGEHPYLALRIRTIIDKNGRCVGSLIVAQDITKEKTLQIQTQQQIRHADIVNRVLSIVATTTNIKEILVNVSNLLANAFQADKHWRHASSDSPLGHNSGKRGTAELREDSWLTDKEWLNALETFLHKQLNSHNRSLIIDSQSLAPEEQRLLLQGNFKSQILMVLRPNTDWYVLGLAFNQENRTLSESEREILAEITYIVTLALEKALLYKRTEESALREQLINSITRSMSQSLDTKVILKAVCEEIYHNIKADRVLFIDIIQPDCGLVIHEQCKEQWNKLTGTRYLRADCNAQVQKLWDGHILVVDKVADFFDSRLKNYFLENHVQSFLAIPVRSDKRLLGIISLHQCESVRHWQPVEINLMCDIANHCAVVLNNAYLYNESRKSEERYRSLFDNANDAIVIADIKTGRILDANSMAEMLTGYDFDSLLTMPLTALHPLDEQTQYQYNYSNITKNNLLHLRDATVIRKNGEALPIELNASLIDLGAEQVIQALLRDMTEQRKLEKQLFHAQRLESIGTLTGGIAHDFNNLLAGILGYAELFKKKLDPGNTKLYNYASIIEQSATHGAQLAQRLVAFARGNVELKAQLIDLNVIVSDTLKLLERALNKTIEIQPSLAANLPAVQINPTQLQQILMNLCINARDAMPDGGLLIVATQSSAIATYRTNTVGASRQGDYVLLTVKDTGKGMTAEVASRIFEPFFTTKEIGKGTGLGLAMVANIVKEAEGFIEVDTQVDSGTAFNIYFPAKLPERALVNSTTKTALGGYETILVIDDEETLRYLAKDTLESYGYKVLLAADGLEAIEVYRKNMAEIDLVLLDIVMPRMNGREVLQQLLKINVNVQVVVASGYCPPEEVEQIWRHGIKGFIPKPYQIEDLATELRLVLDKK